MYKEIPEFLKASNNALYFENEIILVRGLIGK